MSVVCLSVVVVCLFQFHGVVFVCAVVVVVVCYAHIQRNRMNIVIVIAMCVVVVVVVCYAHIQQNHMNIVIVIAR